MEDKRGVWVCVSVCLTVCVCVCVRGVWRGAFEFHLTSALSGPPPETTAVAVPGTRTQTLLINTFLFSFLISFLLYPSLLLSFPPSSFVSVPPSCSPLLSSPPLSRPLSPHLRPSSLACSCSLSLTVLSASSICPTFLSFHHLQY